MSTVHQNESAQLDTRHYGKPGSPLGLCLLHGGQNGTAEGFSLNSSSFPLVIIIPPLLYIHLSLTPEVCDSPGQAAC
jgi:hypothetical protein